MQIIDIEIKSRLNRKNLDNNLDSLETKSSEFLPFSEKIQTIISKAEK